MGLCCSPFPTASGADPASVEHIRNGSQRGCTGSPEVLRRRRGEMHFARKFDSLQKALKEARSAFACDEHRVSAAIGIFEARRKDSAWVRQFQGRLEAEMLAQDFYNYEGTCRAQLIMESRRGA
jgi:hypothetical protein